MSVDKDPRIEQSGERILIGTSLRMSLAQDATPALWGSFMPRRGEIQGRVSADVISLRTFEVAGPEAFAPMAEFEKFALVEVAGDIAPIDLPAGMQRFDLTDGLYAVFTHRGPASAAPATFEYIFAEWLPESAYQFEPRPQFEVLPEGYSPLDPDAVEEIWIPVTTVS